MKANASSPFVFGSLYLNSGLLVRVGYLYHPGGEISVNYHCDEQPTPADVEETRAILRAIVERGGGAVMR